MEIFPWEFASAQRRGYSPRMPTILAKNIAALREHLDLNQTAFGARFKARQSAVSKWISTGKVPGTAALIEMARLAGVSVDSFQNELWSPGRAQELPAFVMLPVGLPSPPALARMFETMLEKDVPRERLDELAQNLARRLPAALERAANSPSVPVRGDASIPDADAQPPAKRRQPRPPR